MKVIAVKVKTNAPKTRIIAMEGNKLTIEISEPAEQNKANIALIKFLSKHFKANVKIVRGLTSKNKLVIVS